MMHSMLQQEAVKASYLSEVFLKFAFLVFNLKMDISFLEIMFQVFLIIALAIHRSSAFSIEIHLEAYLERYSKVVQSNNAVRDLMLMSVRDSICAIQIQSKACEGSEVDYNRGPTIP